VIAVNVTVHPQNSPCVVRNPAENGYEALYVYDPHLLTRHLKTSMLWKRVCSGVQVNLASWPIEGSAQFPDETCLQVTKRNGAVGWLPDNLNQGRLDYYYAVLVVLSVLNIFFFIFVAKLYKYKKVSFFPYRALLAGSENAS